MGNDDDDDTQRCPASSIGQSEPALKGKTILPSLQNVQKG